MRSPWAAAAVCALLGFGVFQFWGNAVRGYIDTRSVFWWWGWQWFNPGSEAEHGPLLVGLAVWLGWRNLNMSDVGCEMSEVGKLWPGVVAMVGALALHALGFVVQQTRISIVAVLLFAWGVMRLGGGARWGRATVFPLGLLLFAIPLGVLDAVGFHLRLGVIASTEVIARTVGIEVVRNGTQLFSPDGSYQYDVAAACSGVRSLLALLALSALIGYLWVHAWWRRGAVFLLAFPLTFVGNVVRIAAIVFAGEWFGQRAGEVLHDWAGFLVFVIVLGGVLAASTWLAKREPRSPTPAPAELDAAEVCHVGRDKWSARVWRAVGVVALAVVGTVGLVTRVESWEVRAVAGIPLAEDGLNPAPLPVFLGTDWIGRETEVTAVEREMLPPDTGYSRRLYVAIEDRNQQVLISIVLSGQDRTSIHRPEICLVGQGWTIGAREEARFEGAQDTAVPAALLHLQREVPRRDGTLTQVPALFAYWFVGQDRVTTTTAERLWHTALNRLRLRPDRWAYVVAQTVQLSGESEADARARMNEVVGQLLPRLVPATGERQLRD